MQRLIDWALRLPVLNRMEREEAVKLAWYIVIGGVTYIINNVLLFLFRRKMGLEDTASVALSYLLTTVCHFFLHNTLTFRKSRESLRRKCLGHFVVSAINYVMGVTAAAFVLGYVYDSNLLATACSTAVTFLAGYFLLNKFVYKLHTERGKD